MRRHRALRNIWTGALLLLTVSACADGQETKKHFTQRGTVELGGSISFYATQPVVNDKTGETSYALSVLPYVGYFIIDGFELGLNPAGLILENVGNTTTTQLRILGAPSYNFRTSTLVTPYVEGLAGITTVTASVTGGSTSSLTGFTFGGRAGIKIGLVERGLLSIGVQYLRITLNPSGASTRSGSNELSVVAGWSVWL